MPWRIRNRAGQFLPADQRVFIPNLPVAHHPPPEAYERVGGDIYGGIPALEPVSAISPVLRARLAPDVGPDSVGMTIAQIKNFFSDSTMAQSLKRSRQFAAPVATTTSVNFSTVNRTISLTGREYWTDVTTASTAGGATSTYKVDGRLLRPTDSFLFSWLSSIAKKFEEFKFTSVRFIYEPSCASTTTGQIAMWFDGDPTRSPPASWNQMINTGANVHGAPWAKHILQVPPWLFSSRKSYYTLPEFPDWNTSANASAAGVASLAPTPYPSDPMEYYPGLYGFCSEGWVAPTGGGPFVNTLGKVYLEYSLTLKTQNSEGFNQLTISGTPVSAELADTSGTGFYAQLPVLSTFPLSGSAIFGGSGQSYSQWKLAGCRYWRQMPNVGLYNNLMLATQDFDVLVTCRGGAGSALTFKLEVAPFVANVAPVWTDAETLNLAKPLDNAGAANERTQAWQLHMNADYFFRITYTTVGGAGSPLTYFHFTVAPFTYALKDA